MPASAAVIDPTLAGIGRISTEAIALGADDAQSVAFGLLPDLGAVGRRSGSRAAA